MKNTKASLNRKPAFIFGCFRILQCSCKYSYDIFDFFSLLLFLLNIYCNNRKNETLSRLNHKQDFDDQGTR